MTKKALKIQELADAVMYHKRLYYAGRPEISDAAFDRLEAELRELAPDHPALAFVGTDLIATTRKVTHRQPMLSLQKVYSEEDLWSWVKDYAVVGMWKIDGASMSLVYEKGRLVLAKTRGNGREGEDVTDKVRWISDIPSRLSQPWDVEVRGELYCSEHQFALLVEQMLARNLERPTSPRNIVAGLLGRKSQFDLARHFNFLAFDLLPDAEDLQVADEMAKLEWLGKQGFNLPGPQLLKGQDAVKRFLQQVQLDVAESEIGLDGAVFVYDDLALHKQLGYTAHHPRFKMSFKWQGQTAISTIQSIQWATSRLGIVTPVAVIEPVALSGATITNITLHNAEHVKAYNLKVGDQIEIVRSGEVIPKFLEVKVPGPGSYQFPKECPSCGTLLEFDEVRLRCPNVEGCQAQKLAVILNWIVVAGIDDLSEKRLENLVRSGLVKSAPDLYRLTVETLMTQPLTNEKMAKKLYENIQKTRSLPAARFFTGLGISGAGVTTWEKLLAEFPDWDAMLGATAAQIEAIDGFAEKSAAQIADGLKAKAPLMKALLAVGVQPVFTPPSARANRGPLQGKSIAITGALQRPRAEIEDMIKAAGGKPASAVSKKTFALVTNELDSTSSKMQKARELNIPIWSEEQLLSILKESAL